MEVLLKKNQDAQKLIDSLKSQIEILRKTGVNVSKFQIDSNEISSENRDLTEKIVAMKSELVKSELLNGEIQVEIPKETKPKPKEMTETKPKPKEMTETKPKPKEMTETKPKPKEMTETKPEAIKVASASKPAAAAAATAKKAQSKDESDSIDVSRFDMRVGRILAVSRNPEADSLFVEQVDVGEAQPRQIVSGLVKYCAESELLGRLAVFLVNLKPAKMRGAVSQGMIMCASSPDTGIVEPLVVPESARPGDRVTVEGYKPRPDDVMNPKKKILETVKPDLRVNGDGVATYRGAKWVLNGEVGVIVSTKLKDVPIA